MSEDRPRVLVIAGYDQSGGAGVLADIKTLEAHGVYGYAVCTAMTYQNEREIRRVEWMPEADVLEQVDVCFASAAFDWVKMGITASMSSAATIIRHVRKHNPTARVVLDPVVKASSGVSFWAGTAAWKELVAECFVLTPNWEEVGWLYPGEEVEDRCRELSRTGSTIYLKGGHNPRSPGRDILWSQGRAMVMEADPAMGIVYPKHGSGCVLASALTAGLALGYEVQAAALRAKRYTAEFLTSNKSLLGWHRWNDCIS
ncbi:MAG TPA: hydroxymethylpyrimidine/phosphomethylpyrimidine kinase [Puia sp.]|nr:hydroxymethylpyrimidine/phosphomethylpyrimidine kinase [Puia sp.]